MRTTGRGLEQVTTGPDVFEETRGKSDGGGGGRLDALRWWRRRVTAEQLAHNLDPLEVQIEEEAEEEVQRTAFVLAGGGSRGAAQVGMLSVLAEWGFVPDLLYGASVGALNAAAFAGDPTPEGAERMADVWRGVRSVDVFPHGRMYGPWQFLQQRPSVHSNAGLRRIIEEGLLFDRLEDAVVPVEVVATSLVDGQERWLTHGPAVEAILASAALPAIFPPVVINGERLIDGGVVDNVPISRAIEAGATRIFVLLCGPLTYHPHVERRPVEAMLTALFIAVHARFGREITQLPDGVEVIIFSVGSEPSGDYRDFSATEELIAEGRAEAEEVLLRRFPPAHTAVDEIEELEAFDQTV